MEAGVVDNTPGRRRDAVASHIAVEVEVELDTHSHSHLHPYVQDLYSRSPLSVSLHLYFLLRMCCRSYSPPVQGT